MTLERIQHCTFTGAALPEPFVQFDLEKELSKEELLPKTTAQKGDESRAVTLRGFPSCFYGKRGTLRCVLRHEVSS